MRLDLETEIRYPDGRRAGVLKRVVVDENGRATAVAMATDEIMSRTLVVPVHHLSEMPGDVLTINLDHAALDTLQPYEEEQVLAVPESWEFDPEPVPGSDVFPRTFYDPLMPVVEMSNLGEGDTVISQGTEVQCLDGRWGVVDEVLTGEDGQITAFVVRPDATTEHDRLVPVSLVSQYAPDVVVLNCTTSDLDAYTEEIVSEAEEPEV
ncbi:MAG TPA: hypothetical protein VFR15_14425 [Chloroflexia bacterium]|nr:hypothetical protein [Chloroflexia bacterium]